MKLNEKEKIVYGALRKDKKPHTIHEMRELFPNADKRGRNKDGSRKKDSWVRNSIRRLVFHGIARRIARGSYEWTGKDPDDVEKGSMPQTFSMADIPSSGVASKAARRARKKAAPAESVAAGASDSTA